MNEIKNFPVGEIIAPACEIPQVNIVNNLYIGDLSWAGLLIVVLVGICLVLVFRAVIGRDEDKRRK